MSSPPPSRIARASNESRVTGHGSPLEVWTVLPVRGIEHGKSRLAGALAPCARAALNRWLLERTLDAVCAGARGLARCVVVSPCRETLAIAARAGAAIVREPDEGCGLNEAARLGAAHAARRGAAKVLVLPCDLPRLSAESVTVLMEEAARARHMVLAPDSLRAGTNALAVDVHAADFRFGARSFARHLELAAAREWTVCAVTRPDLEFDLDTPCDLAAWQRGGGRWLTGCEEDAQENDARSRETSAVQT
jgi:2-phospho-L-lactate/phosphoenolpyruvate guanylyltransferase